MKKETTRTYIINSISEQRRLYSLPKPEHPLVSLINLSEVPPSPNKVSGTFIFNFYSVAIKRGFQGKKLKYGQNYYDFDEGVMAFMAPGQMLTTEMSDDVPKSGWILFFHPDFLRGYPLGAKDQGIRLFFLRDERGSAPIRQRRNNDRNDYEKH